MCFVGICESMRVRVYMYVNMLICVCLYKCAYICMNCCVYTCVSVSIRDCVCVSMYVYVYCVFMLVVCYRV